jgi:hypothetical protein
LDDGDTSGLTGTFSESHSGRAALRREQWEQLERSHHRKRSSNLQKGETPQAEKKEQ